MTPTPLFTPDQVWAPAIDVLRRRHAEHLYRLEQLRGLPARTIEPFKTVDVLAYEGHRFKNDALPACLVGVSGPTGQPTRTAADTLNIDWVLAVEITVHGVGRDDIARRCDWYSMTVAECLLNRLPRHDQCPVRGLEWLDLELDTVEQPEITRSIGQARLLFAFHTPDAVSLDVLPADDSPITPGTPGGAPASPYEPALPWPAVASVTATHDLKGHQ